MTKQAIKPNYKLYIFRNPHHISCSTFVTAGGPGIGPDMTKNVFDWDVK